MRLIINLPDILRRSRQFETSGTIVATKGPTLTARMPQVTIGELCTVERPDGSTVPAQAIAFENDLVSLAPLDEIQGLNPGAKVVGSGNAPTIRVSNDLLGKVVDCLGNTLNSESQCTGTPSSIFNRPPDPLKRQPIKKIFETGITAIDGLCTIGRGQRIGLFAGAGVGKSTLLGMITRNAEVDVVVTALVGERGREVREFIDDCLGTDGMARSVLVVATSDESPLRRMLAPLTATTIAEHFRAQGKNVLLLVDSLTRTARAIREVGLAAGELPVRQGYTPSVYTELPKLLERAGNDSIGSLTAIYTVLTNGEGETDPLGEEIKSILDGHIYLSSAVAQRGIRPAIDLTESVSRVLTAIQPHSYITKIQGVIRMLSRLKRDREILLLGGTPDPELQAAIMLESQLERLLNQRPTDDRALASSIHEVSTLADNFQFQRTRLENERAPAPPSTPQPQNSSASSKLSFSNTFQ
jgi:FliI/YscN family ATPase